ncbi:hypothetical protein L3Q67_11120 [Saccharothrix sp. AJ9571]|nr:hypothetical protein L3Q67_11120 [Saccharothrix sp. AJ9571]
MIVTTLVTEFGKKAAERWLALLAVPGLVFTGFAVVAALLGHARWAEFGTIGARLSGWSDGTTRTLLVAILVVAAAAAAGYLAQALGGGVENLLTGQWSRLGRSLATSLTARRRKRWDALNDGEHNEERNRLALSPPICPTWIGDRLCAPAVRVRQDYGLDLAGTWPRLWLLLPDSMREPLSAARARLDAACALGGWSLLYLALGAWWWPSAVVGVALALTSRRRARSAAAGYADLVESTVDVRRDELIRHFARDPEIGRVQGLELTERFRKGT